MNEDRTPVPNAPQVTFTLRIETDEEMRYVNNSQVDHLGYVSYQVTYLEWETDEELVTTEPAGTLSGNGVYLNQETNPGSSWRLTRSRDGTRVTGTFACTRSPVDYHANGNPGRAAILLLPTEYRPAADVSITVEDAIRVNEDGSDSTDTRPVDFDLTMQSDGYLWYDRDASLTTAGVGYPRYSVDVSWLARPLVPTAPRNLETEDVEADEVDLDWDRPQYDGGDAVDEYKVEVYRNVSWREVEDDISRTRYNVDNLDPYTTYDFRVLARNRAGWPEPSTAIEVTTPRETPGQPRSLAAAATHDQVTLTWTEPSGDVTVTGYRLWRRVGSGAWRTRVYDTGEMATGWEDRNVSPSTTYSYRVAAHNHGVEGDWTSETVTTPAASAIPGSPTGLSVAPSQGYFLGGHRWVRVAGTPEALRQRQGDRILAAVQAQQRAFHTQGQHRPQAARQMRQLRCQQVADIIQCSRSTHGHTRVLRSQLCDPQLTCWSCVRLTPHPASRIPLCQVRAAPPAYIRTDMRFAVSLHCCAGYPCQGALQRRVAEGPAGAHP